MSSIIGISMLVISCELKETKPIIPKQNSEETKLLLYSDNDLGHFLSLVGDKKILDQIGMKSNIDEFLNSSNPNEVLFNSKKRLGFFENICSNPQLMERHYLQITEATKKLNFQKKYWMFKNNSQEFKSILNEVIVEKLKMQKQPPIQISNYSTKTDSSFSNARDMGCIGICNAQWDYNRNNCVGVFGVELIATGLLTLTGAGSVGGIIGSGAAVFHYWNCLRNAESDVIYYLAMCPIP